jgi:hypothetical protein
VKTIKVQRLYPESAVVEQLKVTREWMDNTADRHVYMCFPLTLTNGLGWGISFSKDIRVVWDGIEDSGSDHVKILEGEEIVYTGRGHGTISFKTGILINTDEDVSMLTMPVPNQFIQGAQSFTTLMSTSFYRGEFPMAMKITEPNREIYIPAGTPVAAILPISISKLQKDFQMEIVQGGPPKEYWEEERKYGEAAQEKNNAYPFVEWSKMYRNAVNYDGTSLGKHESKNIRLKTITCPITGASIESPN